MRHDELFSHPAIMNRLFTISDLHTDYKENSTWVEQLSMKKSKPSQLLLWGAEKLRTPSSDVHHDVRQQPPQHGQIDGTSSSSHDSVGEDHSNDVLIIAGDISDNIDQCITTLQQLGETFGVVFFIPGNHDLWMNRHDTPIQPPAAATIHERQEQRMTVGTTDTYDLGPKSIPESTTIPFRYHPTRPLKDSLDKLNYLLAACRANGIHTTPTIITFLRPSSTTDDGIMRRNRSCETQTAATTATTTRVLIVPILAWHHVSFDIEPDVLPEDQTDEFRHVRLPDLEEMLMDYNRTAWPRHIADNYQHSCPSQHVPIGRPSSCTCSDMKLLGHRGLKRPASTIHESEAIAFYMDQLNENRCEGFSWINRAAAVDHVVSFSHFAPDVRVIPEKRCLLYPALMKASGSTFLKRRLERLSSDVHVYGHLHFGWDMSIAHTRFIQAPLGYPKERALRFDSLSIGTSPSYPLLIFTNGEFVKPWSAKMSDRYKRTPRTPENRRIERWVEDIWRLYLI